MMIFPECKCDVSEDSLTMIQSWSTIRYPVVLDWCKGK